jgi:hypothetical protein
MFAMNRLQKLGGVAALVEASLYISIFLFFGAYWQYPAEAGIAEKLVYLAQQKVPLYLVYLFGWRCTSASRWAALCLPAQRRSSVCSGPAWSLLPA